MVGLYINNQLIQFSEDVAPKLTKKSYDIDNPSQLWSDYSKTIEVAGTSEVNILFGYLFNVNIDIQNTSQTNFNPDFNPNLKASARIDYYSRTLIDGYAQLTGIKIDDFNQISYTLTIYGSVLNLFNVVANKKLAELDFSEYNHTWNQTNIVNSWTPTLGSGYVYPMIDYGESPTYDLWNASQFYPAIFAKEYWDKIFNASGFSYTSSFLTSDLFKRLIIPFSGTKPKLSESEIADRIFYLSRATTTMTGSLPTNQNNVSSYPKLIYNDDSSGNNFNTIGTDYNTTTGVWNVANEGRYIFRGSMTVELDKTVSAVLINDTPSNTNTRFKVAVVKYDGTYTVLETIMTEWDGYSVGVVTVGTNSAPHSFQFETNEHYLKSTDEVFLAVMGAETYYIWNKWNTNNRFDYIISVGAIFTINVDPNTIIGDTWLMNKSLPIDISQRDFIMGIFKMFNLFIDIDPDNPTNLIIEPYEDFFTGSEDLTPYLDTSKPFEITPMGMLKGKRYEMKYKSDKDYLNERYEQAYGEVYGQKNADILNDFLIDTYTIQPIFSATPSSGNSGNDRVIPDMSFIDQNGVVKTGQSNIRILYWGGLKNTAKTWYIYQTLPTTTSKTQYPYAGHLNDPYAPTIDLSYGVPQVLYYKASFGELFEQSYTDNNLYNAYWSKYIKEITDRNSKLVTCYMDLKAVYTTLSFRKSYYIKDAYYRLLEVSDYNVNGSETAKCIFLKVQESPSFAPTPQTWRGGEKLFPDDSPYPTFDNTLGRGGSQVNKYGGSTFGNGNTTGGGVSVGDNIRGALVFTNVNNFGGNGNIAGADKVTFIGSSNYYEYREGATIINDIFAWTKLELTLTGTEAASLNTSPIEILPPCASNEYYQIDKALYELDYNEGWTTTSVTLNVQTATSNNSLNAITNLFSQVADAYLKGTVGTEVLDMGEAIELSTSVNAGAGTTNTVKVVVYYRINRI
jgi:hypothetical protein